MQVKTIAMEKMPRVQRKAATRFFQEKTDLLICGLIIETTPLSYFGQSRAANASFCP